MRHSLVRAEIPSPEADRPPLLSSAAIALVCLTLGLMLARWTVRPAPPTAGPPEAAPGETPDPGAPEPETTLSDESAPPPASPEASPEVPTTPEAAPEPASPEATEPVEPPVVAPPVAEPRVDTTPAVRPPAASHGATVRRGRIAYLRCEEGASGAACARDSAIEDAIWAAIEDLPACPTAPAAPGQADLVVQLGDEGLEIRARDTFGAEVVRLDGPRTVACVSPALLAAAALTGSSRRAVLSFRFTLEPPSTTP